MQHPNDQRTPHFAVAADFVHEQYSDADRLRIRIDTHARFSRGQTERLLDDAVLALDLATAVRVLDVGCGAGGWHPRIAAAATHITALDLMRGMLREARVAAAALDVQLALAQGDAQALPFASASFDRVLCAGVLYHVANCAQALAEMRRVLRPGGRAVISTNGAYAMRRLYELHTLAARELDYEPLPITAGHFTMDDLPLVQRAFPRVERHVLEGALVFETPDPALAFYATNRIDAIRDRPADGSHRARPLPRMREHIAAVIAREGAFTVLKSVGFFVAYAEP